MDEATVSRMEAKRAKKEVKMLEKAAKKQAKEREKDAKRQVRPIFSLQAVKVVVALLKCLAGALHPLLLAEGRSVRALLVLGALRSCLSLVFSNLGVTCIAVHFTYSGSLPSIQRSLRERLCASQAKAARRAEEALTLATPSDPLRCEEVREQVTPSLAAAAAFSEPAAAAPGPLAEAPARGALVLRTMHGDLVLDGAVGQGGQSAPAVQVVPNIFARDITHVFAAPVRLITALPCTGTIQQQRGKSS